MFLHFKIKNKKVTKTFCNKLLLAVIKAKVTTHYKIMYNVNN